MGYSTHILLWARELGGKLAGKASGKDKGSNSAHWPAPRSFYGTKCQDRSCLRTFDHNTVSSFRLG